MPKKYKVTAQKLKQSTKQEQSTNQLRREQIEMQSQERKKNKTLNIPQGDTGRLRK